MKAKLSATLSQNMMGIWEQERNVKVKDKMWEYIYASIQTSVLLKNLVIIQSGNQTLDQKVYD